MTDGVTSSLAGRTAIVSGAGRGIGAAIARSLDAAGARVALVARTQGRARRGRRHARQRSRHRRRRPRHRRTDRPPPPSRRSPPSTVASTSSSTTPRSPSASRATSSPPTRSSTSSTSTSAACCCSPSPCCRRCSPPAPARSCRSARSAASRHAAARRVRRQQGGDRRDDAGRWRWSTGRAASGPTPSPPASCRPTLWVENLAKPGVTDDGAGDDPDPPAHRRRARSPTSSRSSPPTRRGRSPARRSRPTAGCTPPSTSTRRCEFEDASVHKQCQRGTMPAPRPDRP